MRQIKLLVCVLGVIAVLGVMEGASGGDPVTFKGAYCKDYESFTECTGNNCDYCEPTECCWYCPPKWKYGCVNRNPPDTCDQQAGNTCDTIGSHQGTCYQGVCNWGSSPVLCGNFTTCVNP